MLLSSSSHLFLLVGLLATGARALDVLECLSTGNFQFVYELNSLAAQTPTTLTSYLALESADTNLGRLHVHAHKSTQADLVQYWSTNQTHLQQFSLAPFMCQASLFDRTSQVCSPPDLLANLLPNALTPFLCYSQGQLTLSGMLALLVHLQDASQFEARGPRPVSYSHAGQSDSIFLLDWDDKQPGCNQLATLSLKLGRGFETRFILSAIEFNRGQHYTALRPPLGYSCPAQIARQAPASVQLSQPASIQTARRVKLRVGLIQGTQVEQQRQTSRPQDSFKPLTPLDSVKGTENLASLKVINLVLDPLQLVVAKQDLDQLVVWDLNSRHKFTLTGSGSRCEHQCVHLDKTSLFGLDKTAVCREESILLELGDNLSLHLNELALDLLTDRLSFDQQGIVYMEHGELVHETLLGDLSIDNRKLCLQRRVNGKLVYPSLSTASLIRRYLSQKDGSYKPHMSSLLVFDDEHGDRTRLDFQVNIETLVDEPHRPWMQAHNPIDLSACAPSATVQVEYELGEDQLSAVKRSTAGLRERIRNAVASHLYYSRMLPRTRVPSIEILPLDDTDSRLTISISLLDRLVPDRESIRLPEFTGNARAYLELLDSSNIHSMAASVQECEQVCIDNGCSEYIFCRSMLTCYTFNSKTGSKARSSVNDKLHCNGYRLEAHHSSGSPKQAEPRLARVIDDIVIAAEQGEAPKVDLIAPVGPLERPTYSHLISLKPTSGKRIDRYQEQSRLSKFEIMSNGHKLKPLDMKLPFSSESYPSLAASSAGYLMYLDEYDPADCAQICQRDPLCTSFSHCPGKGDCLISSLLSQKKRQDPALKIVDDPNCFISVSKSASSFELLGEQSLSEQNLNTISNVEVVANYEQCESECHRSECRSFSLCTSPDEQKYCITHSYYRCESSRLFNLVNKLGQNTRCLVYALNPLANYTSIAKKSLASVARSSVRLEENLVEVTSLTINECSRLCNEDDQCGAFEWCFMRKFEFSSLSCQLGNHLTLSMNAAELLANSQVIAEDQIILPQANCTLFVMKKHKLADLRYTKNQRNNHRTAGSDEGSKTNFIESVFRMLRLDIILLAISFLFVFLVKDIPLAGYTINYHRVYDSDIFYRDQNRVSLRMVSKHPASR